MAICRQLSPTMMAIMVSSRYLLLFAMTLALSSAHATDLKVVLLDSKSGQPLHDKTVCISFHPDPRGSGYDKADACGKTDHAGAFTVAAPRQDVEQLQVWSRTNDLTHCFDASQKFSTAEIISNGIVAQNTCGTASLIPSANAGTLAVFVHQMTFAEVLKSMWHEL